MSNENIGKVGVRDLDDLINIATNYEKESNNNVNTDKNNLNKLNDGKVSKGDANQEKSKPIRFDTDVIKCGPIESALLPFLDASSYFNLYFSSKYISKKMDEIDDLKKSKRNSGILYSIYLDRLGNFFSDHGKFFSDIVDEIFDSDFEKLCSLISKKPKVDQEKFYFDGSGKIVSPTFKLYLKMHMTKIILLELLSIDFLEYKYEDDISIDSLSCDKATTLLKETLLVNMTKNSQEKRVNKIFDTIVNGRKFEAKKTFSDEISDDKNTKLYARYKNQYREVNYSYLLCSSFRKNVSEIEDKLGVSTMRISDPAEKTMKNIIEELNSPSIALKYSFDFFLNHPEEFDNSKVQEILDFGNCNWLRSYTFVDYLFEHHNHKNFSILALQIGLAKRDGAPHLDYSFDGELSKLSNDTPHYDLICYLLGKRKPPEEFSSSAKGIVTLISVFVLEIAMHLCLSYVLTLGLPRILCVVLTLGFVGVVGVTIHCLVYFFIPWIKKLIHNRKDKILVAKARQIVDLTLEQLNQNKKAYEDKLDKQKKFFLEKNSIVPTIENKTNKIEDEID